MFATARIFAGNIKIDKMAFYQFSVVGVFYKVIRLSIIIVKGGMLAFLKIHCCYVPAFGAIKEICQTSLEIFFSFIIHCIGKYFYNENLQKVLEQISYNLLGKVDVYSALFYIAESTAV